MKAPAQIQEELDSCGAPYELVRGKKHIKIVVNNVLAGILPLNAKLSPNPRAVKNTIAQIRRAAKGLNP